MGNVVRIFDFYNSSIWFVCIYYMYLAFMYCRYDVSRLTLPRRSHKVVPERVGWQKRDEMKEQYSDWIRQLKGSLIICQSVYCFLARIYEHGHVLTGMIQLMILFWQLEYYKGL